MMSGVASFVPEMPVPCVDECSRSGVRGVCDATSVLGDSLPETCEVPGALPADVTSDLLGSGPSAFGGRGILVSERVQKHVNPCCAALLALPSLSWSLFDVAPPYLEGPSFILKLIIIGEIAQSKTWGSVDPSKFCVPRELARL